MPDHDTTGRVFLTGASGFVGSAVLDRLLSRKDLVHALSSRPLPQTSDRLTRFDGNLDDASALDAGMQGMSSVIHLVGIIMEQPSKGITFEHIHVDGTRAVIEAAKRQNIRRYIHMSALGTRPDAISEYHKTKFRAEQLVRESGLDFTIFRPSMIHGPRGEFIKTEAMWARKKAPPPLFVQPFMPYFGSNPPGRIQPISVDDVARAFVEALDKPQTIGQTYDLAGTEKLTWPQMHEIAAQAIVGHRRWTAPIPAGVGKLLAGIGLGPMLGFNRDQVLMSQEDNTCDLAPFVETFGWTPESFTSSLSGYASQL